MSVVIAACIVGSIFYSIVGSIFFGLAFGLKVLFVGLSLTAILFLAMLAVIILRCPNEVWERNRQATRLASWFNKSQDPELLPVLEDMERAGVVERQNHALRRKARFRLSDAALDDVLGQD